MTRETATDDAVTRSEKELRIGARPRESSRVRLRKYVVTEHATTTAGMEQIELNAADRVRDRSGMGARRLGPRSGEPRLHVIPLLIAELSRWVT